MACLPGMPCHNDYRIAFPFSNWEGCEPTCISSDKVIYNGPNLPCTGIRTADTVEVAIQKIDEKICSEEFAAQLINTIKNNPVLSAYLCNIVKTCAP